MLLSEGSTQGARIKGAGLLPQAEAELPSHSVGRLLSTRKGWRAAANGYPLLLVLGILPLLKVFRIPQKGPAFADLTLRNVASLLQENPKAPNSKHRTQP